ncbi:redoxin domain-containing protein [Sulfuriroseicoccus oceanibius]|uniref:Redoxin domain-containing protein n=1 Tax=Sulfuriroseicoccus oceanibius TaxID=2707525 RepID=A0A6B3LCN2_9BACT|nr:redoxin domain-containing protein [Sulfuriroseicoccus oceanibius]QQL45645.1 redoxin domain-containing protein [Sulfuriroseicoccus oceanibius]
MKRQVTPKCRLGGRRALWAASAAVMLLGSCATSPVAPEAQAVPEESLFEPGKLKPVDSVLKVKVGERVPDFTLPTVSGTRVSLSQFRGKKNVVIAFVPAAFTPVCSAQYPGYNIALDLFERHDAVLLGMTTDNLPSLHAWETAMGGLDFELLSDFWPHGKVTSEYGVLRSDGTCERALMVIDKQGVLRYVDVHDINKRPPLEDLAAALADLKG